MATDDRNHRDVYMTDDIWDRFMTLSYKLCGESPLDYHVDDVLETALVNFIDLGHSEAFKRLKRFNRSTANPKPDQTEAAAAPA